MTPKNLVRIVRLIDAEARKGFTYKADPAVDSWRSHAVDVANRRPWSGDCDDLASTVLDLCRAHVPLSDRYRLFVSSKRDGKRVDHMIGCVRIDDEFYIVGDTFGAMYEVDVMKHVGLWFQRIDEVADEIVRRGVPWKT